MKVLLIISLFIACNGKPEQKYEPRSKCEMRYSPDGKDSVVYLLYFDGQQFNSLYVAKEQFDALYKQDGYEAVYDYCMSHDLPEHLRKKYLTYKRR